MSANRSVSSDVEHVDVSVGGLVFNSRACPIEPSVANGSSPLRRFIVVVLPRHEVVEIGPATRYTLRRNTASIMKI